MDIELADVQSFETFNQVQIQSPVIFTTSYDEYVLPAFRSNSIDYLLKPILREDLQQSLKKLREMKLFDESPERLTTTKSINIGKLLSELQAVFIRLPVFVTSKYEGFMSTQRRNPVYTSVFFIIENTVQG